MPLLRVLRFLPLVARRVWGRRVSARSSREDLAVHSPALATMSDLWHSPSRAASRRAEGFYKIWGND